MRRVIQILSLILFPHLLLAQHSEYSGVGSCSSSNCHGAQSPRNVSNVLQNEYITWSKLDKHSSAYRALLSGEAKRMAYHLGIADATKDKRCLSCHALVSDAAAPAKFLEDGVSCESCHGNASGWIKQHVEKDSSHARNLELGMTQTSDLTALSATCLRCHLGSSESSITHKLYGAGHPELSFELDTFLALMPPHWNVDQDYKQRKSEYSSAKAWLYGLRSEALELVKRARNLAPASSDFSIYYCSACHHPLSEKQFIRREYLSRPGEARVNLSSALLLNSALFTNANGLWSTLDLANEGDLSKIGDYIEGPLSKALSELSLTQENLIVIFRELTRYGQGPYLYYEDLERLAMGLTALQITIFDGKQPLKKPMDALYKALANRGSVDHAGVNQALSELSAAKL